MSFGPTRRANEHAQDVVSPRKMNKELLYQPFALGLYLGLIFAVLALYRCWRLKAEIKRFKHHLSDKLEIEADSLRKIRDERESLRKENENLRVKVASFNELPDRRIQRDLEVFARAEKRMLVAVPGFAPAWEGAKSASLAEIESEESGKSIPKRIAGMLFGSTRKEEVEPAKTLPDAES